MFTLSASAPLNQPRDFLPEFVAVRYASQRPLSVPLSFVFLLFEIVTAKMAVAE
jgi:hypothetical protein